MHAPRENRGSLLFGFMLLALVILVPRLATAHCDTVDGPVVVAARQALDSGDADRVLIWVQKTDEAEIREAFQHARAVRALGAQAKSLADRWFFETLVRIHRAGEGAPYTGLKPAGQDLGPAIPAADRALETGSAEALAKLVVDSARSGLEASFHHALEAKRYAKGDVEAGRRFVAAYVKYVHYVERLYLAATGPVEGHEPEVSEAAGHKH